MDRFKCLEAFIKMVETDSLTNASRARLVIRDQSCRSGLFSWNSLWGTADWQVDTQGVGNAGRSTHSR